MKTAAFSFLVSLPLLFLAVDIGGGGHGIVTLVHFFCAPLPFVLGYFVIFLSPFFWLAVGMFASQGSMKVFPTLVGLHYGVGFVVILHFSRDQDWTSSPAPHYFLPWICVWVAGYGLMQTILWRVYMKRRRPAC